MRSLQNDRIPIASLLRLVIVALAVVVISSGCARAPWRQPVDDAREAAVRDILSKIRDKETDRSGCIDADVKVFFTSNLANRAISGYVQLLQPAQVKFVTSNPLGQPLVVFVSDGERVQFVNTMQSLFTDGSLIDFARAYELPTVAVATDWSTWLTGRLPKAVEISDIREDVNGQGIWVSMKQGGEGNVPGMPELQEHLFIDPQRRLLAGRVYTAADDGRIKARVQYDNWLSEHSDGPPVQPGTITISELDYGARIQLDFAALQAIEECRPANFGLRRPPGYTYLPLPRQ